MKQVVWHSHKVTREQREELLGQRGVVLWFTGLPGSGKSTVANEVAHILHERGNLAYVLDGDNIRHGLNRDLGFSPEDREENIRRIGEVANLFADAGIIAITAFISPYRRDRDRVRKLLGEGRFIEVYVNCPLEVCQRRDPKGMYARARRGEIPEFTGISAPYEPPKAPEIELRTDLMSVEECARTVVEYLEGRDLIRKERRRALPQEA
ncbi:MAG TPA: adenylyl-sulfate kinase [Candidatus Latescibacteria bacterium]|nr:adenylyl-sulfate kinase [Candidatus Latescibacterota bacterium]